MALSGGAVAYLSEKITMTAGAAITAGRLVEVSAARTVQHAGAASIKVLGVALQGCTAVGDLIAVQDDGVFALTATGAINPGDLLVAAANGTVSSLPAVDPTNVGTLGTGMTNTRAIIGIALEAAADGATFKANVSL